MFISFKCCKKLYITKNNLNNSKILVTNVGNYYFSNTYLEPNFNSSLSLIDPFPLSFPFSPIIKENQLEISKPIAVIRIQIRDRTKREKDAKQYTVSGNAIVFFCQRGEF